jgi:hypothetical protein
MKEKRARAHKQISYKCHNEHTVVVIFEAIADSLDSEGYEEQVREGIDDFCGVYCRIVILEGR